MSSSDIFDILGGQTPKKKGAMQKLLDRTPKHTLQPKTPSTPSALATPSKYVVSVDEDETTPTPSSAMMMSPFGSPVQFHPIKRGQLKQKRKIIQTTDKWRWKPFLSNAREDNSIFYHWVREDEDDEDEEVIESSYPFEELNKKIRVFQYNEQEYKDLIEPIDNENNEKQNVKWTKEETDLLFSLCKQFDLRFIIIHDRFSCQINNTDKTLEDLKERYYKVSKILLKERSKGVVPEDKLKLHPLFKVDYEYDHEVKRKHQLEILYSRSSDVEKREAQLREQLKKIEAIKKKRAEVEEREKKQKLKEEKERLKKEQRKLEKQKKEKEKRQLDLTPAILTIEENIEERVEDVVKSEDILLSALEEPGAYTRSFILYPELSTEDRQRFDSIVEGLGITNIMPTKKVHEAFHTLSQHVCKLMELQKKVEESKKKRKKNPSGTSSTSSSNKKKKSKK
ncbi:hypothetical protein ABK040_008392 [Willaertia magna]